MACLHDILPGFYNVVSGRQKSAFRSVRHRNPPIAAMDRSDLHIRVRIRQRQDGSGQRLGVTVPVVARPLADMRAGAVPILFGDASGLPEMELVRGSRSAARRELAARDAVVHHNDARTVLTKVAAGTFGRPPPRR